MSEEEKDLINLKISISPEKYIIELQNQNKELKKQLEENQNPLKGIFAQVNDDTLLRDCGNMNAEINELKNQQKEFIEYMKNEIYSIEPKGTGINYNCEYDSEEDYINAMKEQSKLITLKEILSKYQEIIGVSDENNMGKSK